MVEETVTDRMVVELETNLDEALRGFDAAEQSSNGLERELEKVEDQSKKTASAIDKTGDESKDTSSEVDKLTKSVKTEGAAADTAADQNKKTGTEIESSGNKAKTASGKHDSLLDSLNNTKVAGIAVVAAITTIVAAIVKIGDAAIDAATKFDDSMAKLQIATGATGANLEALGGVIDNLYGSFPAELETITTVVGDLNTAYGLQGDELEALSKTYLSIAKVTGGDVAGQISTAREVFNKFGVSVEEQSEYLSYFEDVSQSSGVKFDQLISLLAAGDRGFQLLGFNAKQSADAIGQAVKKDGVTAAQELVSALEMGLSKMAGTSEAALKSAETALAAANKDYAELTAGDTSDAIEKALEAKSKALAAYNNAIRSGDVDALTKTQIELDAANEIYTDAITERSDAINDARDNQVKAQAAYDAALKGISGEELEANLLKTIELMRNAKSEGDALVIGLDAFGQKSGKVAGALFGGVLDIDTAESAERSIKPVEQLVEETITLDDKMLMLKADVDKALAPLGDDLLEQFDKSMPAIQNLLSLLNAFVSNLDNIRAVGTTFVPMFHILDLISKWFSDEGSDVITYLGIIISNLNDIGGDSGGVMDIIQKIWSFVDTSILTVLDSLVIFLAFLAGDTDTAMLKTYEVVLRWGGVFGKFVEGGINNLLDSIENAGNSILDFTDSIANGVIDLFEGAINAVINAINTMISAYNSVAGPLNMPTLQTISTVKFEDVKHEPIEIDYKGISGGMAELEKQYAALQAEVEYRKELDTALKEAETEDNTAEAQRIKTIIQELNASGLLTGTSTGTSNEDIIDKGTSGGVVVEGDLVINSPAADASTMMNTTRRTLRNIGGMMH